MNDTTRRWAADAAERAGKTFLQAYFAVWLTVGNADYDTLFTVENLKAGVVGLALSLAMAVGAKRVGAPDSASLLPAEVDPPQPPDGLLPEPDEIPTTGSPDAGQSYVPGLVVVALLVVIILLATGRL